MSVFRVTLQDPTANAVSGVGNLDVDMVTGLPVATSIQKTIYVAGPNRIYRKLKDGDTFTDSNYWKQFATSDNPLGFAFLTVVTDDGSVYSPIASENTFPRTYTVTVAAGSTYAANVIDIVGDNGGPAVFCQINNQTSSKTVRVKLNGSTDSIFDLAGNESQIFNAGELSVTRIEFDYSASGASGNITMEVVLSILSRSTS